MRTVVLLAGNVMAVSMVILYGIWVALPHFCTQGEQMLSRQTPVRTYYDRQGRVLFREPTFEEQWRLDVPLESMSLPVKTLMQGAEDGDFYSHDGVDRLAVMRAMWLNFRRGRIKSGASTITMQLVGLCIGRERSLLRKLRQAGTARQLEWGHSKEWILENYLNRIPFGGALHGIESAARYYFGRTAGNLNWAEASLLCGLPQRPNAYRPDRFLPRARRRQQLVLRQLVHEGRLTVQEGRRILLASPLRFRNFQQPSPLSNGVYCRTDHFLRLARSESSGEFAVHTSWDTQLQGVLLSILRHQAESLQRVTDGAGVVVDNRTGEVLALVGTLDYGEPKAGQVNAATSRRCAGSTLKPFIYAEAIDGGLLCGQTIVEDRPFQYGGYAPGNDNGAYAGRVTAAEALSQSLNTPAIALVARLGAQRVLRTFHRLGIIHRGYVGQEETLAQRLGLSVGLGTCGASLLDLAGAYRLLAVGGVDHRVTFLRRGLGKPQSEPVFSPGACVMISQMLATRTMCGGALEAAWKTGTSTGNHDAWCMAYTPEVTVGIWLGNKTGETSPELVGGKVAAPCAAAVLEWLYRDRAPRPFDGRKVLEEEQLCATTGLRGRPGTCHLISGEVVKGIPLRECDSCVRGQQRRIQILRPVPGTYVAGRNGKVRLRITAMPRRVHWYVDDRYCGSLSGGYMSFEVGHHRLHAVSAEDGVQPDTVEFTVMGRQRER